MSTRMLRCEIVLARPPVVSSLSSSTTRDPWRAASCHAEASPVIPPPRTTIFPPGVGAVKVWTPSAAECRRRRGSAVRVGDTLRGGYQIEGACRTPFEAKSRSSFRFRPCFLPFWTKPAPDRRQAQRYCHGAGWDGSRRAANAGDEGGRLPLEGPEGRIGARRGSTPPSRPRRKRGRRRGRAPWRRRWRPFHR